MRVFRLTVIAYCVAFLILASLPAEETGKQTVYVTRTGKKYHRDGCQYLGKSRIPKDLKGALDAGYTACSRCRPSKGNSDQRQKSREKTSEAESKSHRASQRCAAKTKKGTHLARFQQLAGVVRELVMDHCRQPCSRKTR